ncbi:MAG: lipopolysaccharide biosynthesis protein [Pseudomonadota bacterium]
MGLISSVRWVALSQAVRVAAQLVSMAVLARLLPPASYGLMAMAMTVTNLAFLFRDLGTSAAIIQRQHLSEALTCTLYWLHIAFALALALLLTALAWPVARAYGQEQLGPIITALAWTFPISSLGAVQRALLERASQFRQLARIEAVSAGGGLLAALLVASHGGGVWSLVWQMLCAAALTSLQACLASPWRPRARWAPRELRAVFGFSADFSLFQLLVYLERNADSMIIGKLLGSAALGVYAMAYKVMLFPLQNITGVATRALLPAMSRGQDDPRRLGELYLRATQTIAIVTAPLMAGLFFLREPFVLLVFGPRWLAVADLLQWLAVVGLLQSITDSTGAVFLALGKTRMLLGLGLLGATLQVSAFVVGVRWGIEGVAAAYCAANAINLVPALLLALKLLHIAPGRAARTLGKPLAAAGFMLLLLWAMQGALAASRVPHASWFWLSVGGGALAYAFALLVLLRQDMSDMRALLRFG